MYVATFLTIPSIFLQVEEVDEGDDDDDDDNFPLFLFFLRFFLSNQHSSPTVLVISNARILLEVR